MIDKIAITNFKRFRNEIVEFNEDVNILVGDNETGKSTLLEAIYLVLTKKINGKLLEAELTPYIFNLEAAEVYLKSLDTDTPLQPPSIILELWFRENASYPRFRGNNNSLKQDAMGMKLIISFNDIFQVEYDELLSKKAIKSVPVDFYKIEWLGFDNNPFYPKQAPGCSLIDTSRTMLAAGSDSYLKEIISKSLNPTDKAALSMAYLGFRHEFNEHELLKQIDDHLLNNPSEITDSEIGVTLDLSQRSSWDRTLTMHVAGQPFENAGKGEQSKIKAMLALRNKSVGSEVILFEEPENHLSFSTMRTLMKRIQDHCAGKQLFVSSHSSYVINKLGLNNLILLSDASPKKFTDLSPSTYQYFQKLPGYDTLRVLLSKKVILVEGPSDELVVQRAYFNTYGVMPLDEGTDVISVKGLSFKRFLDLAKLLGRPAVVITDNDGDIANKITRKYADYSADFSIFTSQDESLTTLEPNIVDCNTLELLNGILGRDCADKTELREYMLNNKTTSAIAIFDSEEKITFPQYIQDAITK